MTNETWKDIVGFEGLYIVSNFGNVKGLTRTVKTKTGNRTYKQQDIKPRIVGNNYRQIGLYKNGEKRYHQLLLHRIVMEAFVGYNPMSVNHIDGDKANNRLSNLEYCTDSDNELHKYRVIINKKRGAYLNRQNNRYYSQLRYKGNLLSLGEFDTIDEAYKAYYEKYIELYNKEPWYH